MINIKRAVTILLALGLIVLVVQIATPFISGDLDRFQVEQVIMAKEYLTSILDVGPESMETLSGTSSPYRYGSFEVRFDIEEQQYKVVHLNTLWRQLLGLRGRLQIE